MQRHLPAHAEGPLVGVLEPRVVRTEVPSTPMNAFAISTARSALTGASVSPVSAKIVRGLPPRDDAIHGPAAERAEW